MRVFAAFALTLLAFGALACGGSTTSPTNGSTLNVVLTDSPFSDAKAVLVTFSSLSAHITGAAATPLTFSGGATSRTCDLKKLVGATDVLGTGTLPTGHYTEIELVVSSTTIYFDNASSGTACAPSIPAPAGRNAPVTIPSGDIHINHQFDITSSATTTMTLDFNGDQSINQTGNGQYIMNPVIGVVSVQ